MDNSGTYEIYLAAILHDIGVFYKRADSNESKNSNFLKQEIKELETKLIIAEQPNTQTKKDNSILWSLQFLEDLRIWIPDLFEPKTSLSFDRIRSLIYADNDVTENNSVYKILEQGRHYSLGAGSSGKMETVSENNDKYNRERYENLRMTSIFEGISLANHPDNIWDTNFKYKLPLDKLKLNDEFFQPDQLDEEPDYESLWNGFVSDIKMINVGSLKSFSNTFTNLLEKYTSRVPSGYKLMNDISLFDLSRTSAAFASALYDYWQSKDKKWPDRDEQPFLLVGGDLSGIQKYIYSIIARGAAKNLKGRSFYLQLLIENIVFEIADKLDLPDANIIYKSGGSFYLLAPNTEEKKNKLKSVEKRITQQLFDNHKTDLYLSIDFVEFGENELINYTNSSSGTNIGEIWTLLAEKTGRKKSQRYKDLLKSDFKLFFQPAEAGGEQPRDSLTGEEISTEDTASHDGNIMSRKTKNQIILGEKLKDTGLWICSEKEIPKLSSSHFKISILDRQNYFLQNLNKGIDQSDDLGNARVMAMNTTDFIPASAKGVNEIYNFYFYGGNKYPISNINETPKTFEELAGVIFNDPQKLKRKSSPNLSRIGLLRMDIDNLGAIFRRGLSADKKSFSRYSTLSRSLDYFFSGYINHIWEKNGRFRDFIQIIYSGGDDLFVVGKWDIVIEFATEIRKKFKQWVCFNPELSISGGISIVYPKFPVLKATELAGLEEDNAKKHVFMNREKDAFSLFGYAFSWDGEFTFLTELKNQIKDLFLLDLPSSFASDMFVLMNNAKLLYNTKQERYLINNYQVIWWSAYHFKRAAQRTRDERVKNFLSQWTEYIFTGKIPQLHNSKYHALQILAVAGRWADFERR